MIELSASEGHLYFVAAQHILNTLPISGESPTLWVYLPPQGGRLALAFPGSFPARAHRCDRGSNQPSEICERPQFARK